MEWIWAAFVLAVAVMLAADRLLIHRAAERVPLRSAALWTAFWIAVACVFGGIVYVWRGGDAAGEYFRLPHREDALHRQQVQRSPIASASAR